jgi:hypothetical protein
MIAVDRQAMARPENAQTLAILIKVAHHLTAKAVHHHDDNGMHVGFRVPRREMERLRSKLAWLQKEGAYSVVQTSNPVNIRERQDGSNA